MALLDNVNQTHQASGKLVLQKSDAAFDLPEVMDYSKRKS